MTLRDVDRSKAFLMYDSYEEVIENLEDEQIGKLIRAMYKRRHDAEYFPDDLGEGAKVAFLFMAPQMGRDDDKYKSRADASRKNGKLGGRPKKTEEKEKPFHEQNPFGWDIKDRGLEGLFKSKEMADKMLEWLDYRYELGGFTESASRKAIEQARQAEIRYGPQRCIETMDQCMAGGYKAIIWEKLERNKEPSSKQTDDTTDYLARRIIEEEEKEKQ